MEITFLYPVYLWFLVSIPFLIILHLVSLKFSQRKALLFANFEAIKRVGGGYLSGSALTKNLFFLILRSLVLIMLTMALSGVVIWYEGSQSNFDFILAIDSSGSMLADDFSPNRFEAAKDAALLFIDNIDRGSHLALVSFSGTTFIKQRLTTNFELIRTGLEDMNIEFASGTAVGDAIVTSSNIFEENSRARVIVLLTDGQSNVGVLPETAIDYASKNHVTVNTIGVATEEGGRFEGVSFLSRLDEDLLNQIADNTGGNYFRVGTREQLVEAYQQIAESTQTKVPLRLQIYFLIGALVLLFMEWTLINTKYKTIP